MADIGASEPLGKVELRGWLARSIAPVSTDRSRLDNRHSLTGEIDFRRL
jgi:hypothetical protein